MRTIYAKVLTASLILAMTACSQEPAAQEQEETVPSIENYPLQHETEFGGVYIQIPIDDFNQLGFTYGDSVDVTFSNGYVLEDIPYYNGYYVDPGQPLLIAYPGYDYIKAAVNYGDDLWDTAALKANKEEKEKLSLWLNASLEEHDTATVTLREKNKYLNIQEARDIHYTDFRKDYPSDEAFANFRCMHMGNLKDNTVFRSASPCDNQHSRAAYVDALISQAGIQCILNLADNDVKIERYISDPEFDCQYFLSLYNDDKVIPLALNMNYMSDDFAVRIADGFIKMSQMNGPYLIHCTEGKDRTGFVCMLIEALASADYQTIADDYMVTYDNYYKITLQKDPDKYATILESNLNAMLKFIVSDDSIDYKTADLMPYAKNYLLKAGMTEEQLDLFLAKITE